MLIFTQGLLTVSSELLTQHRWWSLLLREY